MAKDIGLTGNPQYFSQGLMKSSAVKEHDLGAVAVDKKGNKFRYILCGATAIVPGQLQQSTADVAHHTNIACAVAAVLDATITVTLGATLATANQYAGGYIIINDVDGQGETYRIGSHPAADASATLVLTLEDDVRTALTTNSQATLVANPYNGVIVHPTTSTGAPVGVGLYDITAAEYGWLQTHGVISGLNDAGTAIGLGIAPSTNTAGAMMTVAATTNQIGSAIVAGISTEYNPILLRID